MVAVFPEKSQFPMATRHCADSWTFSHEGKPKTRLT